MKTTSLLRQHNRQLLLPLYGIVLFVLLYVIAALLYPGGSNTSTVSKGFSFWNNYWCDLTGDTAKNGAVNPARPVAIAAWVILCGSLGLFWILLPRLFTVPQHPLIQYCGVIASVSAMLTFTVLHDTAINLAGFFGTIALVPAFVELKKAQYHHLLALALVCFLLGLVNYAIYMSKHGLAVLPALQKMTHAFCLFTFGLASYRIYQKENRIYKH